MDFLTYIAENVLYLIPALIFIGWCIKQIPKVPNWTIPFVLIFLGVAAAGFILGWTVDSAVQGVLCAGAAVLGNQAVKQAGNAVRTEETEGEA